ncbi:BTB/POZ domain-containing protein 1-like isoform X2 [Paramacrobiotus metropolitanus]|nr:BTB/POZ domain-containing protein 1-like isoform X2 [Paramacrobiotus metropolitanus]
MHALTSGVLSDVEFAVGHDHGQPKTFRAHKLLLSLSSEVFDTMFNGSIPETDNGVVKIPEIASEAFGNMLNYLYTDQMADLRWDNAFQTLYCAKKYGIPSLLDLCSDCIINSLTVDNCLANFEDALHLGAEKVQSKCLELVDSSSQAVFRSEAFSTIEKDTLEQLLTRDTLAIEENTVYNAVEKWAENVCIRNNLESTASNRREVLGGALFLIRFPLITDKEIVDGPGKTGLLLKEELGDIYQCKHATVKSQLMFSSFPRRPLPLVGAVRVGNYVSGQWANHSRAFVPNMQLHNRTRYPRGRLF